MEETPLSTAVRDAPFPVVQMLFAHSGNINQGHLLHSAVWRKLDDRKTVMEFLIRKGAPVNAVMCEDRPELYLRGCSMASGDNVQCHIYHLK